MENDVRTNDMATYLFCQGTNFYAYDLLGVHAKTCDDGWCYTFRVWAPHAKRITVVGDFNGWDDSLPMTKDSESGIWTATLHFPGSLEGSRYKYRIFSAKGVVLKSDPYAQASETREKTASLVTHPHVYIWGDDMWQRKKHKAFAIKNTEHPHYYSAPMNIYEMHLGSWRTKDGQSNADGQHDLNYREIVDALAPYLSEMHYTHVELLPVMEHPYDGSWGYQVCGHYAPTSRFGKPDDFRYFVNRLHQAGIGVILDWVPAHFPKDESGLFEFDGSLLYEYQGKDRMENRGWGTRYFDVGRPEVQSFLISGALYWLREFHVDGLRVDAVASMLYLDYDREPGEWVPNRFGGNQNLEAVAFFQKLNSTVFSEFPNALMIAEESTSWPMVTGRVCDGGLGFNFKWNMGFANDMFAYFSTDPYFRSACHNKLTFPMMYAFSENYILPISHDEVVHGKKNLIDKMFGSYEDKFNAMRAFLTLMMTYPGKKLLFMGTEFAPFREWDYKNELEWFMLDYPRHAQMRSCVQRLNALYMKEPALHEIDDSWDGFQWLNADDRDHNVISYVRRSISGKELLVLLNFSPMTWNDYRVRVPKHAEYEVIFNADDASFGGSGAMPTSYETVPDKENGRTVHNLSLTLAPYAALILRRVPKKRQ